MIAAKSVERDKPDQDAALAPSSSGNLDAALGYLRRGWVPLPLCWPTPDGRCGCGRNHEGRDIGKAPLLGSGYQDLQPVEIDVREWWGRWPEANVGVLLEPSGLLVIDLDTREAYEEAKQLDLPSGPTVRTGKGVHIYYEAGGVAGRATKQGESHSIDVLSKGYVAMPPSVHASGRRYQWFLPPTDTPLQASPGWATKLLRKRSTHLTVVPTPGDQLPPVRVGEKGVKLWHGDLVVDKIDGKLKPAGEAQGVDRSETLCALGGELAKAGAADTTIASALQERDAALGYRKFAERRDGGMEEYNGIARYVLEIEQQAPLDLHTTDLGNAQRLVERHGNDLRYHHARKQWFVWDGRRWAPDETGGVYRRAQDTVQQMYQEALRETDHGKKEALLKWALRSEGKERIEAMVALARSAQDVAVTPSQLDGDPWLLTVLNGTIDLRNGELRESRREDLITKLAPVEYDPDAQSDLWDRFIADLTGGDGELAAFLQRALGYSLTGDVREEVLFLGHGPAAAGKSTFIEAVKATLGDYASTADFETFLAKANAGGPRNDIARLSGARFVASVEMDEGRKLAEGLVKTLTGGDTVSARFLYHESFEFQPTFKLWLVANHPPIVNDNDDAMWRRIVRVPFIHAVPKERQDPTVKARLRDPQVAGPAVLAWAVRGCLKWRKQGLRPPKVVKKSTESYRREMDPLAPFLEQRCILDPGAETSSSALWKAYEDWARENGEFDLVKARAWGALLKAHGCESRHTMVGTVWRGVGLRTPVDMAEA